MADTVGAEERSSSFADEHRCMIEAQVEAARNPAAYETYESFASEADKNLVLFVARKKGEKHVLEGSPCQDYCEAVEIGGVVLLACSDGVGSCSRSDVGSRLACEAVKQAVEAAAAHCPSEDALADRMLSLSFRERVVSNWVRLVVREIGHEGGDAGLEELFQYGATLMYAAVTRSWIVAGNVGDGQVLVFNDGFGMKLRAHSPKEGSSVRCLVNERCAYEDFSVCKFPRSVFSGVLLTTDGMYECLERGSNLYRYADQARERFFDRDEPEPYIPFGFEEKGEPFKDLSALMTMDDCSLALCVDTRTGFMAGTKAEGVSRSIRERYDLVVARRAAPSCLTFLARKGDCIDEIVLSCDSDGEGIEMKSVKVVRPKCRWSDGELRYSAYGELPGTSLEQMHGDGAFRANRRDPLSSDGTVLRVFDLLAQAQREAALRSATLNDAAPFLIMYDGSDLYVKEEAFSATGNPSPDMPPALSRLFDNVLGVLSCEAFRVPVFAAGYISRGMKVPDVDGSPLFQVQMRGKECVIANVGEDAWLLADGGEVRAAECISASSAASFTAGGRVCCYVPKE